MVPPASHKVSRVSWYSGSCQPLINFAYGIFTLSDQISQNCSAIDSSTLCSPQPRGARTTVWALSISLAATLEIEVSFFSSGYLDVSVPPVVSTRPIYSGGSAWTLLHAGSPIRKSAGQSVNATNRSLSQLITSFIGFLCQGIHRVPLISSYLSFAIDVRIYQSTTLCNFQGARGTRIGALQIGYCSNS